MFENFQSGRRKKAADFGDMRQNFFRKGAIRLWRKHFCNSFGAKRAQTFDAKKAQTFDAKTAQSFSLKKKSASHKALKLFF
jgi:hypothetical protein